MTVALTILTDPRRAEPRRELAAASGITVLRAAHDAGIDVTATCGGRGRCTSCRVKFVAGAVPPPPIGGEVQLGDDQVREGYRPARPCVPTQPGPVPLAPPPEGAALQVLRRGSGVAGRGPSRPGGHK